MTEKVILLQEKWTESAARDSYSVACAFAVIGPGIWLQSAAMQWLGFLMLLVVSTTRASGIRAKNMRTLDEAKAEIDALIAARDTQERNP